MKYVDYSRLNNTPQVDYERYKRKDNRPPITNYVMLIKAMNEAKRNKALGNIGRQITSNQVRNKNVQPWIEDAGYSPAMISDARLSKGGMLEMITPSSASNIGADAISQGVAGKLGASPESIKKATAKGGWIPTDPISLLLTAIMFGGPKLQEKGSFLNTYLKGGSKE